jgi:hypothetical protein
MQSDAGPSLADGPLRDGKTWHGGKRQPYTNRYQPRNKKRSDSRLTDRHA